MDNQKFGMLIKDARIEKGYTQKKLATILGVTDKAVSKWECGKSFPDITLIESISNELNISVGQLVGVADNSREEAIMIEWIGRKIKTRVIISIVVLSLVLIKFLARGLNSFLSYWILSDVIENCLYLGLIIIGVISLISSIVLIKQRKIYENNEIDE